jgi:hypothetical protein
VALVREENFELKAKINVPRFQMLEKSRFQLSRFGELRGVM